MITLLLASVGAVLVAALLLFSIHIWFTIVAAMGHLVGRLVWPARPSWWIGVLTSARRRPWFVVFIYPFILAVAGGVMMVIYDGMVEPAVGFNVKVYLVAVVREVCYRFLGLRPIGGVLGHGWQY